MAFRKALREARRSRKLSQEKLAELADLDRTYIGMLERGVREPSLHTVFKIARGLRMRARDLVALVEAKLR